MDKFLSAFREGKNEKSVTQSTNLPCDEFSAILYKQWEVSCPKVLGVSTVKHK